MQRESGETDSPIWLIGDSSPPRWTDQLDEPLDPRHPARHNIWTPVLDRIQDHVYRRAGLRMDDSKLYVRNAVHSPDDKPPYNARKWSAGLLEETNELGLLLDECRPKLVFTFGAFAFEFARRSRRCGAYESAKYWSTKKLGEEFNGRVLEFDLARVNVVPLLHVSIARRHFLKGHRNFTGECGQNYFDHVGLRIGKLLVKHRDAFDIWVDPKHTARQK